MKVAIIGSGNMANGIGTRVVAGKNSLTIYDRNLEKAKELAKNLGSEVSAKTLGDKIDEEIVILTLPYNGILEVVEKYKDLLKDKILVDISNPLDFKTFQLIPKPGSSAAEEILELLPQGSKVIKAFNTTFAGTLVKGEVEGKKLDVFIAGDSEEAKNKITQLIESGGLRAIDAGPLKSASVLEQVGLLHISLQSKLGNTWMSALKILP